MERLRLLFLVTEDWSFVSHRLPLAVAAKQAGFEVTVLTRCGTKCDVIRAASIEVVPFAMARQRLNPLKAVAEILTLTRHYQHLGPISPTTWPAIVW